jgi:outer membrane protein assembly factor BamA
VIYAAAADTVAVQWIVRKRANPNRLAAILGLSRDDQNNTQLSGQVQLLLANIAGTGRRLELDWSDDGADRSDLGVSWLEPLVLGTPLDTELLLDQEVLQGVHTRFQSDVRVNLPVAGVWGVELGLGRDRSTFPSGEWARSSRLRSRVAIHHRRFDLSVSGWQAEVAVESAKRQAEARPEEGSEATALQEEQQTLLQVDLDGEVWLGGTLSLGLRGHYAGASGDEESLPLTEQYRLGGARSLRGYREDQFHGEQVASIALELRVGRAGGSRLYTFLDVGYVRHSQINPETEMLDRSIDYPEGFGVGIETAGIGGNISLAIGFPGTFALDEAKMHVSLIQAF